LNGLLAGIGECATAGKQMQSEPEGRKSRKETSKAKKQARGTEIVLPENWTGRGKGSHGT